MIRPAEPQPPRRPAGPELRLLAEQAARAAGQVARRYFRTRLQVRLKADASEVSEADDAAQAAAVTAICAARGHADPFITEETLVHPASGPGFPPPARTGLCWVIDPIDGTRNFVRGIPLYACAVAVLMDGLQVAAATYAPERDALVSASQDEGLRVDNRSRPGDSLFDVADSARNSRPLVALPSTPRGPIAHLSRACLERYVCRNLGSTALHLAMLATGELDGVLADNPRLWDLAAGWLLVRIAGGRITGPGGEPLFPVAADAYRGEELPLLAGAPRVHAELLALQLAVAP